MKEGTNANELSEELNTLRDKLAEAEQERDRLRKQLEPGKIARIVQGMQSLAEECGWRPAHSRPGVLFIRDRIQQAEARAAAAEAKAALADEFRMFLSGAARKSAWEMGWIARYDALTPTHESEEAP